jgi:hypothetical protein
MNINWKDKFKGQDVLILGNGPSLNKVNFNFIEGKKVIVMNSFEKMPWKDRVEIVAHCLGEPYENDNILLQSFENSLNGTNSLSFWLHFSFLKNISHLNSNKSLNFVLPCFEPSLGGSKIRLDRPIVGYQTTAQLAIQVALYMGFGNITLLGFDHDFLAVKDFLQHSYSDEKDPTDQLNKFSYYDKILLMKRMWEIYGYLKKTSTNHQAKIVNSSPTSYLDIFDFKKID